MHAVGREATLYAARAGVDLIFHGFDLDDECIAAMKKSGSMLCPTLTQPKNVIEFTQPHEPAGQKGRLEATVRALPDRQRQSEEGGQAAGIPFLTGTDTGFAVTPYGEWHARELELFVDDLGFTPAAALRAATEVNARFMSRRRRDRRARTGPRCRFHRAGTGRRSPISGILQDKRRLRARLYRRARDARSRDRPYDPRQVTDFSLANWTDLYTQARVAELGIGRSRLAAE